MDENRFIHENIYKYRRLANLTQAAVAQKLGISRSTYARQEHSGNIKIIYLKRLSEIFQVSIEDLISLPGEKKTPKTDNRRSSAKIIAYIGRAAANEENRIVLTTNEYNIIKIFRNLSTEKRRKIEKAIKQEISSK